MPDGEMLEAMYGPSYPELVAADHDVEDPKEPKQVLNIARGLPPGRFADLGCGSGLMLEEVAAAGLGSESSSIPTWHERPPLGPASG